MRLMPKVIRKREAVIWTKNYSETVSKSSNMSTGYQKSPLKCGDWKYSGVRPHKEKINISKEIINKTRGAVAPYKNTPGSDPIKKK